MGMYDTRCAITGVNVAFSDAVMVALAHDGAGLRPVTLGVAGAYDGYGCVGDIVGDRNTELIMEYFLDRARAGEVVFDQDYHRDYGNPPRDIENLLRYFERNFCDSSDERPALAWHGRPIVYCMVSKLIWDAVAATYAPTQGTVDGWFKEIYGDSPIATAIYQAALDDVADHLRAMHAVDRFLREHRIAWSTPDIEMHGAVYDDEENDQFVAEARQRFGNEPAILAALDRHVEQLAAARDDED